MVLAFAAIGVRLFDLQARDRSHLASLGLGQRVRTVTIPAERGNIFDRTGKVLAVSVPQTTIVADPRVIKDPVAYAAKLAPIVQVDQAQLEAAPRRTRRARSRTWPARSTTRPSSRCAGLDLIGISYPGRVEALLPDGTLAAPVVGFVGTDNTGLGGMESHYDKLLTGKPGSVQVERDPQGNEIPGGERQVSPAQARPGPRAHHRLVAAVEHRAGAHCRACTSMNAKGGTAVVVDVQTGDVLAMATVDGADRHRTRARPRRRPSSNRPVTDVYEPGSTNKVITMAGAIQEGLVDARHHVRRRRPERSTSAAPTTRTWTSTRRR